MLAALLQIIGADSIDIATRQSCSVWLKNRVQTNYTLDACSRRPDQALIASSDRAALRLASALKAVVAHDFPERWPGLVDDIKALLGSGDVPPGRRAPQLRRRLPEFFPRGLGFTSECLGQHEGAPQLANLGDGNGYVNETAVLRWDYGDPSLGTCRETVEGGTHFHYWAQNSSAVFMATSYEMPIAEGHNIVVNGYNLGRCVLSLTFYPVSYALSCAAIGSSATSQTRSTLTNTSTFSGTVSYAGFVYSTSISYVSGLLGNTSVGVNHGSTVGIDGQNALDGLVAVLDVKITTIPKNATKSSAPITAPPPPLQGLIPPLLLSLLLAALSLLKITLDAGSTKAKA
ncbi:hypothetical protein B0H16DRAFT_1729998 [Mycena metata]|uniref:Uncharacterized protein n=1 Tax=Mycena metata TaxID=1033252 RepID=A0AAD7IBY5_9AGAR|nr:hypothetical protein B0H16DRAFT_1729998 [Mycena metata]